MAYSLKLMKIMKYNKNVNDILINNSELFKALISNENLLQVVMDRAYFKPKGVFDNWELLNILGKNPKLVESLSKNIDLQQLLNFNEELKEVFINNQKLQEIVANDHNLSIKNFKHFVKTLNENLVNNQNVIDPITDPNVIESITDPNVIDSITLLLNDPNVREILFVCFTSF